MREGGRERETKYERNRKRQRDTKRLTAPSMPPSGALNASACVRHHPRYKTQNEWVVYGMVLISTYLIVVNSPTYFTMFSMGIIMMIW